PGAEKVTRGWDANRGLTYAQRGKEDAADYRYFPDPDLLPVTVTAEQVAEIRKHLPEPPATRRARFQEELGLSAYDADVLVNQGGEIAAYFEQVAILCGDAKQAANWVTQDILRELKERRLEISEFPVRSEILGTLLKRITDQVITIKSGRELFTRLLREHDGVQEIRTEWIDVLIDEQGLKIVKDTGAIDDAITIALDNGAKAIEDFRAGKQQALGALIGNVMKQVKGADAKSVRELIIARIHSLPQDS
ncbi:MAG TPA: Asp-tRNA(Asn)/Glu-tRNA(Gln) amidotransferase GatCAB subunit B, partial [Planctomicrobium sp.]|nr:Asp-tRNA(Asn)/Glu-tRNA(Gln) amidotransferase GatCAB subunit B [Planctomicrobium sp.]